MTPAQAEALRALLRGYIDRLDGEGKGRAGGVPFSPSRLTLRNCRTFEALDLEIPYGASCIVGPNGAGKTTIMDSFATAMFGERGFDQRLSNGATDELQIGVEFGDYRLRRSFSPKGRGKTVLDFEKWVWGEHAATWMPLTRESIRETQAVLEDRTGLTREIFDATGYLRQKGGRSLIDLKPAERSALLGQMIGLGEWETLLGFVKADLKTCDSNITGLVARIGAAQMELEHKDELANERVELQAQVERKAVDLQQAERASTEAAEALTRAREQAAALEASRALLAERVKALADCTDRLTEIAGETSKVAAMERERDEARALAGKVEALEAERRRTQGRAEIVQTHGRLIAERDRLRTESVAQIERAEALRSEALELQSADAPLCPECEQPITDLEVARQVAKRRADADEAQAKMTALDASRAEAAKEIDRLGRLIEDVPFRSLDEIEAELAMAHGSAQIVAALTARLERMAELHAERERLTERLPELETAKREAADSVTHIAGYAIDVSTLEADAQTRHNVLTLTRSGLEALKLSEARVSTELDRLASLEAGLTESRRTLLERQDELDVLKLAERACSRDGVPVLVLENVAIPALEVKANEALSRLGGKTAQARIELRTQRERKTDGGLSDSLDIVLVTGEGYDRSIEHWSGSEQRRVDVALMVGLREIGAADCRLLLVDEPVGLDRQGKDDLIALLNDAVALGFERVLLSTNEEDLKLAFDSVIEIVVGEDGRSRIAGAEVREAAGVAV